jgi:hypothetical protein
VINRKDHQKRLDLYWKAVTNPEAQAEVSPEMQKYRDKFYKHADKAHSGGTGSTDWCARCTSLATKGGIVRFK